MPRAQQLGRYHLLDRIAFGGMAEIYRAKTFDERGEQHIVAVKRVLGHLAEDDDFVQMLVDEAKICGTLRHPNIAAIYEFARSGEDYFIAMEYVDGKDSRTILDRCRQLGRTIPAQHCGYIAWQVAEALEAAHTQHDGLGRAMRIIHRDISPSNLLCSYTGEVKLCDFGIAKATLSRVQTKTGVIKGKVKYMSPEQAMGRKLDHRSDLFSLGTVLYELLTGHAPFQAPSEMELLFRVRDAKYRPLHELLPTVPNRLEAVVERALQRARSARFQSAREMGDALRGFLTHDAPRYKRSHMGRFLRDLFAEEIEHELRRMEAYVVHPGDATQVGENLIADVLGPDAMFRRFSPVAGDFHASPTQLPTRAFPRIEDNKLPTGRDMHTIETVILDRNRAPTRASGRPRRRILDAAFHQADTKIIRVRESDARSTSSPRTPSRPRKP
ncbi:MAG TPA: serine/threonine-protein kinase [Polyangia bacterium]|nr:serine/threonine-protein kinase [Polyangia bacterium]